MLTMYLYYKMKNRMVESEYAVLNPFIHVANLRNPFKYKTSLVVVSYILLITAIKTSIKCTINTFATLSQVNSTKIRYHDCRFHLLGFFF